MNWRIFPASVFSQFERQWDALNESSANSLLLDRDFIAPLLQNFSDGRERLAVFGEPAQAMAIVKRRRPGVWETFQPSQAPVGLWVGDKALVWEEILPRLQRALPDCVLLGISQIDPDHFERPPDTPRIATLDYIKTARLTIEQSFEEYWRQRGKHLRHNLKRQRNRLARDGISVRLETIDSPDQIADAVRDYGRLESAGWKTTTGTAVSLENAQGRFYAAVLKRFSARGEARIYRYWFGDKLVAADLCLESRSVSIGLKTTYDESEKTSSPGLLMREEMFKRLFDETRAKRIEFYGKVMDWHTKWSDEIRTLYHINHYRFGWLRRLHERRTRKVE